MNATRRKLIDAARELVEQAQAIIEGVAAEERDAFDNLPESLQDGERGQAMSEAADNLDNLADELSGLSFDVEGF